MGKHAAAVAMIRLVRELQQRLQDSEDSATALDPRDSTAIDNVVNGFLATLPKKVADEVLHG